MFIYILRNLLKNPSRTLQQVFGAYVVLLLLFSAFTFNDSIQKSLSISGDARNVLLVGVGSEESLERSEVAWNAVSAAKTIPGLKKTFGTPIVSPEAHYNTKVSINGFEKAVMLRGITPIALEIYPSVSLLSGQFPKRGEVMVGRLTAKKLGLNEADLKPGKSIIYESQSLLISGIFAAPGTVMEAEIWVNLNDLMVLSRRDTISCINLRLAEAEFSDVDIFTKKRLDLSLSAIRESDYYKKLASFYKPIQLIAWLTAILITLGALFGAINTFYAAIQSRCKELATLQAIGYTRLKLFIVLSIESLLLQILAYQGMVLTALWLFPKIHLNFGSIFFTMALSGEGLLLFFILSIILSLVVVMMPTLNCLYPSLNKTLRS